MQRQPNMHDVAAAASVSHQTVSRVLNHQRGVRPETRERVLVQIERLGYRRNQAARSLVTRRSRVIGVLRPEVTQHGATSSVQAVEAAARAAGYFTLVTTAALELESARAALGFLLDQDVEGLVVVAPHAEIERAVSELHLELPLVALQSVSAGRAGWVGVDQELGARLATEHLLGLGHTRIAHVAGPAGYFEADARRRGWETALARADLAGAGLAGAGLAGAGPDEAVAGWCVAGDWTARSGFAAAALLPAGTTAVFCANDQAAFGLLAGLRRLGRRVPADVSVVGFDDVPEAEFANPPLTTVRQDFRRVGEQALSRLLQRIDAGQTAGQTDGQTDGPVEGPGVGQPAGTEPVKQPGDGAESPADVVLAPELVVRESTVPPP